jgi:hypothetical protein
LIFVRPLQARLVTLCQQVLALGVVLVVLTPASGVVSLDIVGEHPGTQPGVPAALMSATVPTTPVRSTVTEVPLTGTDGGFSGLRGRTVAGGATAARVTSTPQAVTGFAAVGVTWQHGEDLAEDQIDLQVRTRTGDEWSDWEALEYHDEHGPDAGSAEAASARPGTEPTFVGDVDDVQVKALTDGVALPDDLSLALVDPGSAKASETEKAADQGSDETGTAAYDQDYAEQGALIEESSDGITLQAARARTSKTVAQPTIYSRAQWGADESIRNKSSLRYGTINGGFVHHTVNANDYTEAQVPAILRSIYAYHVKSRGWSDIGYNFLVDRFGRIWEGRYGGIDKPVVGAHTLNYNEYSFAMSAIGNFDVVQPPDVMLRAYGQLFAWKLSLHGVNPASTSQKIGRGTFQAINGHRDAGSTACPGKYLYAQLPLIRQYAAQAAPSAPTAPAPPPTPAVVPIAVSEPNPQNNLDSSPYPDLVVRRAADGRGLVLPTGGLTSFQQRTVAGKSGWDKRAEVLVSPDLTGDGIADLVTVDRSGVVRVRAGKGNGRFGATAKKLRLRGYSLVTAVGDINGDGRNDLVARFKGRLTSLLATGRGGFDRKKTRKGYGNYRQLIGAGDVNGDGRADLMIRTRSRLLLQTGYGTGRFAPPQKVAGSWSGYNRYVAGDFNGDARSDLVARTYDGDMMMLPGRGDGTYGAALGPATNLKSMRWITGSQMVGGSGADLVGVSGKQLVVVANRDTFELGAPIDTGVSFAGMDRLLNAGDVNRDGFGDVLASNPAGELWLFAGNGTGTLAAGTVVGTGWNGVAGLSAVGDVTGDGIPDLIGTPAGGAPSVWAGNGSSFAAAVPIKGSVPSRAGLPSDLSGYDWVLEVQAMKLKGQADYIVRDRMSGVAYVYGGRKSGVSAPRLLGEGLGAFDLAG